MANQEKESPQPFRYAYLKKKNKRIYIGVFKGADGTVSIAIETVRLIGSWKDRKIVKSSVGYGLESFIALYDISRMLTHDSVFLKTANRELGQLEKNKMSCQTNIERI